MSDYNGHVVKFREVEAYLFMRIIGASVESAGTYYVVEKVIDPTMLGEACQKIKQRFRQGANALRLETSTPHIPTPHTHCSDIGRNERSA